MSVDDTVASTDLQNPADALEFLAHVAERDSSVANQLPPMHSSVYERSPQHQMAINNTSSTTTTATSNHPRSIYPSTTTTPSNVIDYPPLAKAQLTLDMIQALLYR
jgi:hypothetical protein